LQGRSQCQFANLRDPGTSGDNFVAVANGILLRPNAERDVFISLEKALIEKDSFEKPLTGSHEERAPQVQSLTAHLHNPEGGNK